MSVNEMANNDLGSTETVIGEVESVLEEIAISENAATTNESSQATTGKSSEAGGINLEKVAKGYVCPISLELMVEPVLAEDGILYEYDMIRDYFKTCEDTGSTITSPTTRENIGTKLVRAPGVKSAIEELFATNVQTDELSENYRKAKEEKERRQKDLINRARDGEVKAMVTLGNAKYFGKDGFLQNKNEGMAWLKKAYFHESKCPIAAFHFAYALEDMEDNANMAFLFNSISAERGCDAACFAVADYVNQDPSIYSKETVVYYLKMGFESCQYHIAGESQQLRARNLLDDLQSQGY